jgi:aspartyl-tRNA(Asn)/glutamyl-tRNA(Gln) amidotransferase subunit A
MGSDDISLQSATQLAQAIRDRRLSPVEVTDAFIARIDALNPKINAFCTPMFEIARHKARLAEDAQMRGTFWGPLHGVPYAIKDSTDYAGVATTNSCVALKYNVPTQHSPSVERLEAAGAIALGKTTTPDMAWKGLTDSLLFGESSNPWNRACNPGGSSGGSAAAVCAGLTPMATGTDGAGSIRIPASFCGVFGLKPSFGRVPLTLPNVNQHTHEGPITRTVADAALMLDAMAGPDSRDLYSLEAKGPGYLANLEAIPGKLRIGWSPTLGFVNKVDEQVLGACQAAAMSFAQLGHAVEAVDLDLGGSMEIAKRNWSAIMASIVFHRLADHVDQLDPALVACARAATNRPVQDFLFDKTVSYRIYLKLVDYFTRYDLLLTPTVACLPFANGRLMPPGYPDHDWDWLEWAPYSSPFNLFHNPAASVPAGFSKAGLPIGLQIVGPRHRDLLVLQASRAFETVRPWADRRPPL